MSHSSESRFTHFSFPMAHNAFARVVFDGDTPVEQAITQKLRRKHDSGIYCIASKVTPMLTHELYAQRISGKKVVFILVVLEEDNDSMARHEISELKAYGIHAVLITPSDDTYEVLRRL